MRQRLHTTICRRTLTLLGLVGLAALLVLPGSSLAGEGTSQNGPLTELQAQPGDPIPNDVVGGVSFKVLFGLVVPGGYVLNIPTPFASPTARVFASAGEQGVFGGAQFAVVSVIPQFSNVQVVVIISAPYIPTLSVDLLIIP
jgi:hypothetical protein